MNKKASITCDSKEKTVHLSYSLEEFKENCLDAFGLHNEEVVTVKLQKGDGFKIIKTDDEMKVIIDMAKGTIKGSIKVKKMQNFPNQAEIENKPNMSNEINERNKQFIDEKLGPVIEQIQKFEKNFKNRENELDDIIADLRAKLGEPTPIVSEIKKYPSSSQDRTDKNQMQNERVTENKPSPNQMNKPFRTGENQNYQQKKYSLKWLTDKRQVSIQYGKDYPFQIRCVNDGDNDWPKPFSIFTGQQSTIHIDLTSVDVLITKNKELRKNVTIKSQALRPGLYYLYISIKHPKTNEIIGDPLQITVTIAELTDEEKLKMINGLKNMFTNVNEQTIIDLCQQSSFNYDKITTFLNLTTQKTMGYNS